MTGLISSVESSMNRKPVNLVYVVAAVTTLAIAQIPKHHIPHLPKTVETHKYSGTPNPPHAPLHSSRMPYDKHSGLALPTHHNVRLHPTKTTPTRDASRSHSVDLASSMNQYATHNTNTSLGNNIRQSTNIYQKHKHPTTHKRTKIFHCTLGSYNVGPLEHPSIDSKY